MCGKFVLILIFTAIRTSENLNILVLFPSSAKSHYLVFKPLFIELSRKGHTLDIINYFNKESNNENIRQINLKDIYSPLSMNIFNGSRFDKFKEIKLLTHFSKKECEIFFNTDNVANFLEENNNYDVILAELFHTNCYLACMKKYSAPTIGLSSTDLLPWMYQWFGSPENPSYIPVTFMDYNDEMTFFERVENTLMLLYSKVIHKYMIANPGNEYSKKYLGIDLHEGGDILYNISLILVNRHFTLQTSKPLSPNVIEVGGIHLRKPKKLPEDLQKLVKGASNEIIIMSMGSTLKGTTFPEDQKKIFLKVFSSLKQTVIWKWENDTMEDLPKNVIIQKWLPQQDLLCHPNIKLFITHGGLLSTQEAINCGVPMLILPQFADQHYNAAALKKTGASLTLKLREVTEKMLADAIQKTLTPEFFKNAKALSDRFKDRPLSPMDTAIYWIEYVARHKGAPFMRTAVTNMPFYQYLLLDVTAFLFIVLLLFIYICFKCTHWIYSLCFSKKSEKKFKSN